MKEINSRAKKSRFGAMETAREGEGERSLFFPEKSKSYCNLQNYLTEDEYKANPFHTKRNTEAALKNKQSENTNPFRRNISDKKNFQRLKLEQFMDEENSSKKGFEELQSDSIKISESALEEVINCSNKIQVERVIKKLVRKVSCKSEAPLPLPSPCIRLPEGENPPLEMQ